MPRSREDYEYDGYHRDPWSYDRYGRPRHHVDPKWVDPNNTKEKWDNPYSYSEFFIFGGHADIKEKGVAGFYSDRLWTWWLDNWETALTPEQKEEVRAKGQTASKAFDELWKKHVGIGYPRATAEGLSAFFTEYNQTLWPKNNPKDKKVQVVALAEGCNISSGYPYWIVWYKEVTKK